MKNNNDLQVAAQKAQVVEVGKNGKPLHKLPSYEKEEELINVITHAFGAAIGVIAAVAMVTLAIMSGSAAKIVGSIVFGFGLIWLYTMSTLYHNEKDLTRRRVRQKFDHLSINILIASSVTFFVVAALANTVGYIVAAAVWILSIIAMVLNSINVKKFRAITMAIYVLTGWMPIFLGKQLFNVLGLTGLMVLLAGGLFYTLGLIAYAIHKKYMHAIWHVFVLGGSISHIVCAIWYVLI